MNGMRYVKGEWQAGKAFTLDLNKDARLRLRFSCTQAVTFIADGTPVHVAQTGLFVGHLIGFDKLEIQSKAEFGIQVIQAPGDLMEVADPIPKVINTSAEPQQDSLLDKIRRVMRQENERAQETARNIRVVEFDDDEGFETLAEYQARRMDEVASVHPKPDPVSDTPAAEPSEAPPEPDPAPEAEQKAP